MKKEYYKQFVIPFTGLKQGLHEFDFKIETPFFEDYEVHQKVNGADVHLSLLLEKKSTMLILNFRFEGTLRTECDRCMENMNVPVSFSEKLIVKTVGEDFSDTTEEIVTLKNSDCEIDITHYIYEYLNLQLPQRNIHDKEQDCNPEMLKYIINNIEEE